MGGAHRGMVLAAVEGNFQGHSHDRHNPLAHRSMRRGRLFGNLVTSFLPAQTGGCLLPPPHTHTALHTATVQPHCPTNTATCTMPRECEWADNLKLFHTYPITRPPVYGRVHFLLGACASGVAPALRWQEAGAPPVTVTVHERSCERREHRP